MMTTGSPPAPDDLKRLLGDLPALTSAEADAALGPGDPTGVLVLLAEEAERLAMGDLKLALAATERLVGAADRCAAPLARARTRRARAQALAYANEFTEALATLAEGISIASKSGEPVEAARARLASLHALARQGRLDDAIEQGEAARRTFLDAGQPPLAARADINLGVVRRMRDEPRRAIEHFDRARPLLLAEPIIVAQLDSNRAEALLDLNEFERAEEAFGQALLAFEKAGLARAAAIVEGNLADLMSRQGRLDAALAHFEHARRLLGETDAPGDVARLESERAEVLAAIGLHAEAAHAIRQILPVLGRHGLAWESARSRVTLGRALIRLGESAEAETLLDEAANAFAALDHPTGAARARLLRADLLTRRGDLAGAEPVVRDAIAILQNRPAEHAAALLQLAAIALQAGRVTDASAALDVAVQVSERLDLPPLSIDLLHARARVHRRQADVPSALRALRLALVQVERIRGTLRADHLRAAFLGERASLYEECFEAELDAGGPDAAAAAFGVAERAKSRALLDMLHGGAELALPGLAATRGSPGTTASSAETRLIDELASARGELNALYARLDSALLSRQPQRDPEEWQQRMHECERRIGAIQTRLAATGRFSGVFAEPIGMSAAQALLTSDAGLLQIFPEQDHFSVIVVRSGDAHVFRRIAPVSAVQAAMERLSFQISKAIARGPDAALTGASSAIGDLRTLHALLLAPLRDALSGCTRLYIIPHGPLHALPFHALHDGEGFLVERCEILYSPSASVLSHLPSGTGDGPQRRRALVVGLADPTAPVAEAEARVVAQTIARSGAAVTLLVGEQATRERFLHEVPRNGLVHLATHARFSTSEPLTSGVRLADGWITVRDALAPTFDEAVVTLSACESGRSAVGAGDEPLGLIRGVLAGGASRVLMSLWQVHDQTTSELMAAVYSRWYSAGSGSESGMATALRSAQIDLLRSNPHPAVWAPFALVGAS